MRNGLRPIRKRLGAEEYMKKYCCIRRKNSRDICIGKMGFQRQEKKRDDIKE